MAIRFDTQLLTRDFELSARRKKLSLRRAALRAEVQPSALYLAKQGNVNDITVTTLARMLNFIGAHNVEKYIYEEDD